MGKLLIVADSNSGCKATPRGLELASKLGLNVEIVGFTFAPLKRMKIKVSDRAAIKKRLLVERKAELQALVDKFSQPGQKVSVKTVWEKDISAWVIKQSARGYEAVVKTGQRNDSILSTSTDWRLLRECSTPVLIVAEKKWHKTKPILAALDLGSTSKVKQVLNHQIIERGLRLAKALETELKLICAIEVPTLLADLDLVDSGSYAKHAREDMKPHIRELAEAHGLPLAAFRCKRGPVAKVITSEAAKVRAQLVIMGTVGRQGVSARLLGNTAESVLSQMKTDVLAIKVAE